jgi:hypothetical protein
MINVEASPKQKAPDRYGPKKTTETSRNFRVLHSKTHPLRSKREQRTDSCCALGGAASAFCCCCESDPSCGIVQMKASKGGAAVEQSNSSRALSRLALFDHLPRKSTLRSSDLVEYDRILHPATIKLGGLYSKGHVLNDDDRVTSLLAAFVSIIRDYKTPPNKILREDLDRYLSKQVRTRPKLCCPVSIALHCSPAPAAAARR